MAVPLSREEFTRRRIWELACEGYGIDNIVVMLAADGLTAERKVIKSMVWRAEYVRKQRAKQ